MDGSTKETLTAWVFLTPALAVLGAFGLLPIGYALYVSLHEWRIRQGEFVGLQHYQRALGDGSALLWFVIGLLLVWAAILAGRRLAQGWRRAAITIGLLLPALWVLLEPGMEQLQQTGDPRLYNGFRVTFFYAVGTIPMELSVSMLLAYFLFKSLRGKGVYRILLFLPYVTPVIASAVIFRTIFSPHPASLANQLMGAVGLGEQRWLYESKSIVALALRFAGVEQYPGWVDTAFPSMALVSIVLYNIWVYVGYDTVILLAGLSAIPRHYYEAAEIDGASPWQTFRHVTLPLVSPTLFFLSMVGVIGTFKAFNHIYMMRTPGARDSVDVLSVAIFDLIFEHHNAGYAAAMAFILFVAILALTLLQNRALGRRVFYGD